jgi:4-hydroxythreonine-4-phosphate dehydrogenase
MTKSDKPIAITMGDPAGIGPEVIAKVFADPDFSLPAVVYGDAGVMRRIVERLAIPVVVRTVASPGEASRQPGVVDVVALSDLGEDVALGRVDARAGAAAYGYIVAAIEAAQRGDVSAIATAPIHKESLKLAGVPYPGHTEMLADHTGTRDYAMMLFNNELRVIMVTVHVALSEAIALLTVERELTIIRLAHEAARRLGVAAPRVAVAGLNPHAGENGLFGTEDLSIIAPAVARARDEGIDCSGPWPGDTVFMQARQGRFDIVVAQYHDQGLIPVKYLGIDEGVNVTVGLPFVRTSVDHGTAFDIAGTGKADHRSMRVAIDQAAAMTRVSVEVVRRP